MCMYVCNHCDLDGSGAVLKNRTSKRDWFFVVLLLLLLFLAFSAYTCLWLSTEDSTWHLEKRVCSTPVSGEPCRRWDSDAR